MTVVSAISLHGAVYAFVMWIVLNAVAYVGGFRWAVFAAFVLLALLIGEAENAVVVDR